MNLRRKRLRLMRDTQWRGYARTATGNPILLSQVRSMANLSVLGNSAQSGTPSPDNPVEVVGTGEKNKNLIKVRDEITQNGLVNSRSNGLITIVGESNVTGGRLNRLSDDIILYAGKSYTVAFYGDTNNIIPNTTTINFSDSKTYAAYRSLKISASTTISSFTPDEDITVLMGINVNLGVYNVKGYIALYEGLYNAETLPMYEPYGYKVPITAQGQNLFDVTQISDTEYIDNDGSNIILTGYSCSSSLSPNLLLKMTGLKPEDTFTTSKIGEIISGNGNSATGSIRFLRRDDTSKVFYMSSNYGSTITTGTIPDDFNDDNWGNALFYGCNSGDNKKFKLSEIQVVKGEYTADTMPSYEPYKEPYKFNIYIPQPLHGVGDAHDAVVLDFDNRKAELRRTVNIITLTGDEKYKIYTNTGTPSLSGYYISEYLVESNNRPLSKSNVFLPTGSQNAVWIGYGNKSLYFASSQFYADSLDDKGLSNFIAFIKQQYDSGNPATIYYDNSKSTPTTTDITDLQQWDNLPQLRGTWILTANGGTEPTLEAEYYSNERSIE